MILKVKGLDCASCALKIEESLKKDSQLNDVRVDYLKESISFNSNNAIDLDNIKKKILDIDSNIVFLNNKKEKHTYYLSGMDCASCALKLEDKLNKQSFIEKANIDFKNERLIIEYDEDDYNKLKEIVFNFEDNLSLQKEKIVIREHLNYKMLISIIISLLLIVLTIFTSMEDNLKLFIYLIAYLIVGYDILIKVVKNLFKGNVFDENFLMGIATIAAFLIGEHLEAIAIMLFYKVGQLFQDLAVNKSRKSISDLMNIQADYANVVMDNEIIKVDPSKVKVGDLIIIKPGEKIPLDGVVFEGSTFLDTKALTGESIDYYVKESDEVLSGSINKESLIKVRVSKLYEDSTLYKILELVENSSLHKASSENFITKFARYYTPIIVLLAILLTIIPPLTFSTLPFDVWVYRALIFLVISCPCALVISIPLGFFSGIGNASRHGILIKGANYLEALNDVDSIVFDKSGTITKGDFKLHNIYPKSDISEKQLLEYVAYAEYYSNHPIATSIKKVYLDKIDENIISGYQEISGQGIKVKINDDSFLVGNELLMKTNNILFEKVNSLTTIIHLSKNNKYLGYLEVGDEIKADSIKAFKMLKELNINNISLLSGDNESVVKDVAQKLGIKNYFAKLLPQDKIRIFENMKTPKNKKKVFVGDGINDAPLLAQADIGIAMGGIGSDAAIEAADIIIMNDEISKIATAIKISHKTKKIVTQNIVLALSIKLLVLVLGVFGLASIWQAVIADVGVAIIAIFNSMRILNNKEIGD